MHGPTFPFTIARFFPQEFSEHQMHRGSFGEAMPQVLALIQISFPQKERGIALGLYGATLGLASIIAQILGGFLISSDAFGLGWRNVFLVNVPIGAASGVLTTATQTANVLGIAVIGTIFFGALGKTTASHSTQLAQIYGHAFVLSLSAIIILGVATLVGIVLLTHARLC
ncbi:MFS transporter [Dictyobacter arantiisoli]|uniref:Major facilitator superfamily (MFS) profile domain-containing protein n=1 Tax=Dictyobacter arantiisoli TaxID=2014874 RepID=A0A5A5T7R6_9CHLR|nr:MFS transporter [Dictyobacter arantiisoli]GCF07256.1 hypothetical protein KDI_08200 [Dictyobacter arantiisoli]